MLYQKRRSFSDVVLSALCGLATAMVNGGIKKVPQPADPVSSDLISVDKGEELRWDRRTLPEKKLVSVKCDYCGG